MNALPLIFTFLMIFLCIASTFLKDVKGFLLVETTLNSLNDTERKLNNSVVRKAYRKIKTEPTHQQAKGPAKQTRGIYYSRRSFFPPFENSKFNIEPLIKYEGEVKLHPLFAPLAEMLRLLYGKAIFDQEAHLSKIEYRLLDAIIAKARKHPESQELVELFPEDPLLSKIYYQMLKGTNQYNQKNSVPPLSDFVTLRKDAPAIFFSFASPVILNVFFNTEVAKHILCEERKKWENSNKYYYFSKNDLQLLLAKNPILASKYSNLAPYIDFSKQMKPRNEIGGIDPCTGLSIKKNL